MNEFGDRIRTAAAEQSQRSSDARAPRGLRRRIGRARALRVGGSAASALVALAGVGAAGVGFTGIGAAPEPSPSASVDLSIDSTVEYATVPFPETDVRLGAVGEPQRCGEPAPDTHAEDSEFSSTFETPTELELDPATAGVAGGPGDGDGDATVTVSYSGADELHVFIERPRALYLRDGMVVGWEPQMREAPLTAMSTSRTVSYPWEWTGFIIGCRTDEQFVALEPGDYEMVLVTDVTMDEQSATLHSLGIEGYTLPPAADAPAFREGGYECADAGMYFGQPPITCTPHALPGVEIDYVAGTATVPYDSSFYDRDVDLTYVSEPVDVTLLEGPDYPTGPGEDDVPTYEPGTVPACGDLYTNGWTRALQGTWDPSQKDMRHIEEGDTLTPSLWQRATGWTTAEAELAPEPRLWLTRWEDVEIEEDGGGSSVYQGQRLVGWIDATPVDGPVVTIDRYDGPAEWPLTVTETGWCDGMGDPGPFDAVFVGEPAALTQYPEDRRIDADALVFGP
ncbi:hypothetical protein [Demequina sp. SO4-18]|uniref:hypothetical protein n=1 Tax=Demequina sp. SO4-18 TaxID=3401026 RepID=UPI003B59797F